MIKSNLHNIKARYPIISFILFALMLISLGNLLYFKALGIISLLRVFKASTSMLFVLISVASYKYCPKNHKFFRIMLTGFILSLIGDVFLSINHDGLFFILGLGSFSIAHIMFTISFCALTKLSRKDIIVALTIAIPMICFVKFNNGFNFGGMLPLIIMYTILISMMVTKAFSLLILKKDNIFPTVLIISGAVLFYTSDFILLYVYYYKREIPLLPYINLITYYLGQGLLALSFIKGFNTKQTVK